MKLNELTKLILTNFSYFYYQLFKLIHYFNQFLKKKLIININQKAANLKIFQTFRIKLLHILEREHFRKGVNL